MSHKLYLWSRATDSQISIFFAQSTSESFSLVAELTSSVAIFCLTLKIKSQAVKHDHDVNESRKIIQNKKRWVNNFRCKLKIWESRKIDNKLIVQKVLFISKAAHISNKNVIIEASITCNEIII